MGHAEMLLAVAGLNQLQVEGRVKVLASGDWSSFTPRERVVLGLANRLSKQPQKIQEKDIHLVVQHLGADRTLDWIYHISWCNFMTRVADAFQIPLERDNVFQPPPKAPAASSAAPTPPGDAPKSSDSSSSKSKEAKSEDAKPKDSPSTEN